MQNVFEHKKPIQLLKPFVTIKKKCLVGEKEVEKTLAFGQLTKQEQYDYCVENNLRDEETLQNFKKENNL